MGLADGTPASGDSAVSSVIKERRFGDYVLGRQLGSGGMGVVYEAHQTSLNRKVALKFIRDSQVASPALLRRFAIEAEATARLHHPGIVGIHEVGEAEGHPYFSMDLVDGDNLRAVMSSGRFVLKQTDGTKSNGRSRQVEIARLMGRTARAVHHAHERGVLHRDLKPGNILVDRQDEPHLTDFGLAKILRETADQPEHLNLTPRTEVAGTAAYMSPEQASSEETTSASDIYGLGAVLYELLTGQPPFKAATLFETLKQVQEQSPRRPRLLNPLVNCDLETICLKCLEKNPSHRYASAEALSEDLENWIHHRPIKARSPGPLVRTRQWIQRNPVGAALICTLIVGLVVSLVLLGKLREQKQREHFARNAIWNEKVDRIRADWQETNHSLVVISANDLATVNGRDPTSGKGARRLNFGSKITGNPITVATVVYARLFGHVQEVMGRELHQVVELDLNTFKPTDTEFDPLLRKEVDFMVMDATSYVLARQRDSGVVPILRLRADPQGAVVAGTNSGIWNLPDLRRRSVVIPTNNMQLTVGAKACFWEAGIFLKDLMSPAALTDGPPIRRDSSRLAIREILTGRADAGVAPLNRYEADGYMGLRRIHTFRITPQVIVARAGLDELLIESFKRAMISANSHKPDGSPPDSRMDLEEFFPGVVAVDDAYFNDLREAMRKAARFDSEPDPFPPNAGAPSPIRK
jgi:serine/threonine protein kinase